MFTSPTKLTTHFPLKSKLTFSLALMLSLAGGMISGCNGVTTAPRPAYSESQSLPTATETPTETPVNTPGSGSGHSNLIIIEYPYPVFDISSLYVFSGDAGNGGYAYFGGDASVTLSPYDYGSPTPSTSETGGSVEATINGPITLDSNSEIMVVGGNGANGGDGGSASLNIGGGLTMGALDTPTPTPTATP